MGGANVIAITSHYRRAVCAFPAIGNAGVNHRTFVGLPRRTSRLVRLVSVGPISSAKGSLRKPNAAVRSLVHGLLKRST